MWEVEEFVRDAQRRHPGPETCPPKRLYVAQEVWSHVLEWGHLNSFSKTVYVVPLPKLHLASETKDLLVLNVFSSGG